MPDNEKGYYEIDVDAIIEDCGASLYEAFAAKDLKQRKLFINDGIDQLAVHEIVKHIMQFNSEDKGKPVEDRKPITLYVVTAGGSVVDGIELIDVISSSKTPVHTVNIGYQYSMGFLIGLSGHKRYGTKNSTYLMHDGTSYIHDSGSKAADTMEFSKRLDRRMKDIILSKTKITEEKYESKERVEWYMFAEEAKEYGVIDYIIGVDCDIDEVV